MHNEPSFPDLSMLSLTSTSLSLSSTMSTVSLTSASSPKNRPTPTLKRSQLFDHVNQQSPSTPIMWNLRLPDEVQRNPTLSFIADLHCLDMSEDNISGFLYSIEHARPSTQGYSPDAQTNIALFVAARKILEQVLPTSLKRPQKALFYTSHLFFRANKEIFEEGFHIKNFIESATEALEISKEETLGCFVRYIKNCIHLSGQTGPLLLEAAIKNFCIVEGWYDWLSLFLQPADDASNDFPLYMTFMPIFLNACDKNEIKKGSVSAKAYQKQLQIMQMHADYWLPKDIIVQEDGIHLQYYALCLAHYMVTHQPHNFSLVNSCVTNKSFPPIHYDASSKDIYIVSGDQPIVDKEMEAKIRTAVQLPFSLEQPPSLVTLTTYTYGRELRESAEVHQKLTGKRGIWPMLSSGLYTTKNQIQKFTLLTPHGSTLHSCINNGNQLSIKEILTIAEDLAYGLECLHKNMFIHGMIDTKHAVIRETETNQIVAGWIDFRLSRKNHSTPFEKGYYGSHLYTSPEIFGKKNWPCENNEFTGHMQSNVDMKCDDDPLIDLYKADIWAFGQLLFELRFRQLPPWTQHITSCYSNNEPSFIMFSEAKREFFKEHNEWVQKPMEVLVTTKKREPLSSHEQLDYLIYSMLQIVFDLRPNITEIKETIRTIKNYL
ncbi:MAG: protein kinase [Verrucomicrobia bacterium]|nr:protein kinase [Verrucomicrobiota bacterium]